MSRGLGRLPTPLPRIFYGWWIVAAAFLLHALSGGLLFHSFGVYFVHLQAEFGWSRAVISGAFSLARLESGFLGPFQAWLIGRMGSRAVVQVGLLVLALGFVFISRVESVASFYGAFLFVSIGSGLCGFLTMNIVLANWFERKRAMAIGLSATGGSLGGLVVPGLAWTMSTFGWRATALFCAPIVLLVGLPAAQLVRQAPELYGYSPDGALERRPPAADARVAAAGGLTARQALRTPAFWLICSGHSAALLAISSLAVHLVPFLVGQIEMAVEAAAGVVAAVAAVSVVAHVVGGFIGDRMNKRWLAAACMGGHTLALVLLAAAAGPLPIFAFALLQGTAWGVRGPLMTALRADYFGRRSLATIEGFAALVTTAGLVAGPISTGFLADQLGDYRLAFALLALVTGVGGLFFALARRPARGPLSSEPTALGLRY